MAIRLAVLSILVTSAFASQTVFTSPANLGTAQEFIPAGTLDILSETSFTALAHPKFPKYGVRIKKSNFCDETVRCAVFLVDFAGCFQFLPLDAVHTPATSTLRLAICFFYFFESRSEPDRDDVIFWTNGGPGCSSGFGLLMELGPCRVESAANGTKFHPESWNSKANVFFIDQPIGTGFSDTTEDAAKDIAAFVAIFFAHFKKFQGRGFHLAGESYGGRYLPVFAAEIYDQNSALITAGLPPINLTSVIIGNGQTDYVSQVPSWQVRSMES
ncbi:Alpha/Beta hydrolase protein [Mycena rebaudengoi]|nr:Alpha/Beta hydrolase protein [Mycena rebaudengoi]